jgi:hypothetical protein
MRYGSDQRSLVAAGVASVASVTMPVPLASWYATAAVGLSPVPGEP